MATGVKTTQLPTGTLATNSAIIAVTDPTGSAVTIQSTVSALNSLVVPATISVADESTDTSSFVGFFTGQTGDLQPKTNSGLTFNSATGDLSSTLIAGIANANLLDKTAPENISGIFTFTTNPLISSVSPNLIFIETDASTDNGRWDWSASAEQLKLRVVNDAVNIATNIMTVDRTTTTVDTVSFPNGTVDVTNELTTDTLRATSAGDASLSSTTHGFQVGGTSSANIIVSASEIMSRNAGATTSLAINNDGGNVTMFDNTSATLAVNGPITGTSFGGITSANLLDKSATETISGAYSFSTAVTLNSTLPRIRYIENDASTDNGTWTLDASSEIFFGRIQNDALSVTTNWIEVQRTTTTVDSVTFPNGAVNVTGALTGSVVFLNEQANANTDVAGDGQFWVRSDTPNTAVFTDDAGTDFDLNRQTDLKRKASTTSRNTTTTLADDPDLAGWTLAANKTYRIWGKLRAFSTSATPDIKYALTASTVPDSQSVSVTVGNVSGATKVTISPLVTSGTSLIAFLSASIQEEIILDGYVIIGGSDITVDLQWAQNTSDATDVDLTELSFLAFELLD